MHGLIFQKFQEFIFQQHGLDIWEQVVREADLANRHYSSTQSYPDNELVSLVAAAGRVSGSSVSALLQEYGYFLAPELLALAEVLGFVKKDWHTFDLLEHTFEEIHQALNAINPLLTPPKIHFVRMDRDHLAIAYRSPRRLCLLLKGIVAGMAHHFHEQIDISESVCMLKGGALCRINLNRPHDPHETIGQGDLLRELREIMPTGSEVQLYAHYKGVPISYPGIASLLEDGTIRIKSSTNQLLAIRESGSVIFSLKGESKGFQAVVRSLDLLEGSAILENPRVTGGLIGQRKHIRIRPLQPIPVELLFNYRRYHGRIEDLSSDGLAVVVMAAEEIPCEIHSHVTIQFDLDVRQWHPVHPGGDGPEKHGVSALVEVMGISHREGRVELRLHVSRMTTEHHNVLEQYLMKRQMETIQELRKIKPQESATVSS